MSTRLFAVEQYDDEGGIVVTRDPLPPLPAHVRLASAVHLPADGVVIAFVTGADQASVQDAVTAAGWRVDRINPADWLTDRTDLGCV